MFGLTVLGCHAPFPAAGGACSGYLLRMGDRSVLIDCGSGVLANLENVLDYRRGCLDAVILTHLHHDHISDFWLMRYALAFTDNNGLVLPVFTPGQPTELLQMLPYQGVELCVMQPGELSIAGGSFRFFETKHPILCYGLRVDYEGASLVYTADTSFTNQLIEEAAGADLLLCECSLCDEDAYLRERGHMTSSDAGRLAAAAGVRRLVLTHFWPDHNQEQLVTEAKMHYDGHVEPAAIGRTWVISGGGEDANG